MIKKFNNKNSQLCKKKNKDKKKRKRKSKSKWYIKNKKRKRLNNFHENLIKGCWHTLKKNGN